MRPQRPRRMNTTMRALCRVTGDSAASIDSSPRGGTSYISAVSAQSAERRGEEKIMMADYDGFIITVRGIKWLSNKVDNPPE